MPLRLRHDISTTDTPDGLVLLDEISGRYWQLNHTGAQVLCGLLDGNDADTIAAGLAEGHGLEPDRARRDVETVITQLTGEKLLMVQ